MSKRKDVLLSTADRWQMLGPQWACAPSNDAPRFVELWARTCYSFLEGASHPEEMVQAADELGLEAIGICDRNGLYGMARAHAHTKKGESPSSFGDSAAAEHHARLIVGAELEVEDPALPVSMQGLRLGFLVETHLGYTHLCQLLTRAHAEHPKGEAGIDIASVADRAEGLTLLVPALGNGGDSHEWLEPLVDAFGIRATIATWRHRDGSDALREDRAKTLADHYALPIIASARPLYHSQSRKCLADVVHCIRHKVTLDEAGTALSANAEAKLRSAAQMAALFSDHIDWVEQTVSIAERCTFSLDELRYQFPSDELCRPGENANQTLRRHVELGLLKRYPNGVASTVVEQVEKELKLIAQLDVAPYFLSVQQIVEIARDKGILCQGRGSAANSAVCFALGVTAVDPARSNLLFERFLSAERAEPPDIDVDFEHERREEVIQEIYRIYGRERAAMVSEVIAYRGKSALREVGKVFGLSLDQIDRLSKIVMYWDSGDLNAERVREQGLDPEDARLKQVVAIARALQGFPRHLSIHVGGFVLSAEPLDRVAPIEPASMEGRTVIPWDKDDVEVLGFFKVDVLGLGMLTCIRKAMALIHETAPPSADTREPFCPIEQLARIPPEDPITYDAICMADTIGVFQIESRAQMAMLPRLRPRCYYDLVIEVAIVRPGPIQGGMVHPYLRRRTGEEAVRAPHPCLEPILRRTLGVPLFQEQVMQIAMVGADYSAGEADQLRRDMAAWKKHGRLERHRDRLLEGFKANGLSQDFGEKLFQQIQGFGEYGFPESHAASFALLVYASAWLKTHHPSAFACALLNAQPMGFYSASSIVRDAQNHGVVVAPVSIEQSEWDNTLEPDKTSRGGLRMRLGFRQIAGLGELAAQAIVSARAHRRFEHVPDVVHRAGLKKNELEALAESGAMDMLVAGRREAIWDVHAPRVDGLFEGLAIENATDTSKNRRAPRPRRLPPMGPSEQLVLDYRRLGLSLHDHPMRHLRPRLALELSGKEGQSRRRVLRTAALANTPHGTRVWVAGLVIGRQRPATASGVTFVTLEDESGIANLVVPLNVFDKHYLDARNAKIMLICGQVQRAGMVIHILVSELHRLDRPGEIDARSRDFH